MAVTLKYRFAMRRRTAADWTAINEILIQSEWGHESDTGFLKIGDGVTPWNDLEYQHGSPTGVTAGDYGTTEPSLVAFSVGADGRLTQASAVPLIAGNGISFDVNETTGALTISVNGFVNTYRTTRSGDQRVTPNGDIRVTR